MKNPNNGKFYDRLMFVLDQKALTAGDLADAINVAHSTVYRWNEGIIPHRKNVKSICDFLGLKKEWLIEGKGEMSSDYLRSTSLDKNVFREGDRSGRNTSEAAERESLATRLMEAQEKIRIAFAELSEIQYELAAQEFEARKKLPPQRLYEPE